MNDTQKGLLTILRALAMLARDQNDHGATEALAETLRLMDETVWSADWKD